MINILTMQIFRLKLLLLTFIIVLLYSNEVYAQSTSLDQYIKQALQSNGLIQEQTALIEEKKIGLQLANKQFSPEVNFGTRYTLAVGGRNIAFPIGDLLNPVNNALNDLTKSNQFPTYENQKIQFLPSNFYDFYARITQPILQPEIKTGQSIKKEQIALQELQRDVVIRDVIRDVKKAYYHYLQSRQGLDILAQGQLILDESDRVTQSLIRNDLALPSTALRIQAERAKIKTQMVAAMNQSKDAAALLNYLVGRPYTDSVHAIKEAHLPDLALYSQEIKKEELNTLDKSLEIQQLLIELEKKSRAPKLGAQVDLGSQNFNFKWGGYALGGVQLEIPLWNNKKSIIRRDEIKASMNVVAAKKDWASKGFQLQMEQAKRQVISSIDQYHSHTPILDMSRRYYTEILRKFKEGLSNPSELIDAQTQITLAQLQQNIAFYQSWVNAADLERLTLESK